MGVFSGIFMERLRLFCFRKTRILRKQKPAREVVYDPSCSGICMKPSKRTKTTMDFHKAHRIQTPEQAYKCVSMAPHLLMKPDSRNRHEFEILKQLAVVPLGDENFLRWPASTQHHHVFEGGLLVHTAQVLIAAYHMSTVLSNPSVNELIVACVWHDTGKLQSYEPVYSSIDGQQVLLWQKTERDKLQGHIAKSYNMFREFATAAELSGDTQAQIGHMILAHHGRREWGSPVEPQMSEAWCLHAADMLSSHFLSPTGGKS